MNPTITRVSAVAAAVLIASAITACSKGGDRSDDTTVRPDETTPEVTSHQPTSEDTTSEPISTPEETTKEPPVDPPAPYDYGNPVPESDKKGRDWFDDAIFIGDSRTDGFIMFEGLSNAGDYAYTSLNVSTVFTKQIVEKSDGSMITVIDSVRENSGWKKVYIMFGINELGWPSVSGFVNKYAELVRTLRDINPEAEIYVQSILPLGAKANDVSGYCNNFNVERFNEALKQMTEEEKVYYVNVAESMTDENGCLPDGAAADGIHPGRQYCGIWLDYLLTHTVG